MSNRADGATGGGGVVSRENARLPRWAWVRVRAMTYCPTGVKIVPRVVTVVLVAQVA